VVAVCVLLVADRCASASRLKRLLDAAGLPAEAVEDPEVARARAAGPGLRVIVVDLRWSRADPLDALRQWRGGGALVLALAPGRDAGDTVRALDVGADDILGRPFDAQEFVARVRALARRASPGAAVLRVGDLEIDSQSRAARRGGRALPLTRREFALLEALARRPGEVITREALWGSVWGPGWSPGSSGDSGAESNVMNVLVRSLRNKIDRGFDVPLILTRWGEGYFLRGERGR
jgi:DNA-binding response OmpR family regulator